MKLVKSDLVINTKNRLQTSKFFGALNEYVKGLKHYEKEDYGSCIHELHKSFESTMKNIAHNLKIKPKNNKTGNLIKALCEYNVIPSYLDNKFQALKGLFEKGLPNIRNQDGISHGQGSGIKQIPLSIINFAINESSVLITFLIDSYNEIFPNFQYHDKLLKKVKYKLDTNKRYTTAKTYFIHIEKFLLDYQKDIKDLDEETVINYIKKCKERYNVRALWVISTSLRFLTNEFLKRNFDYTKIRQKTNIGIYPKLKYKAITEKDFRRLVESSKHEKHKFWMKFIWNTGVNLKQFKNMKIRDIEVNNCIVKIRDGNKEIFQSYITKEFAKECKEYIKKFTNMESSEYVFWSNRGSLPHQRTIEHAIDIALKNSGINKPITPYVLRISNPHLKTTKEKPIYTLMKYDTIRAIRSPFKVLTRKELDELCSGNINRKHRFWFKIIYELGIFKLKRNELFNLKKENFDLNKKKFIFNKRELDLPDILYNILKEFFNEYPEDKHLFQNKYGQPINADGMRMNINRARKVNNISKRINYENLYKSILEI